MNDNHVSQARAELATALNDATLVDDLPYEEANSYEGRRAKWRARVALEAAQVHATLALVDELARHRPVGVVRLPDELRCTRAVGTRCKLHDVDHWRENRP